MAEDWKRYEGQVVDGTFVLHQHLDGSVFLTDHGHQKAAIKFLALYGTAADSQLLHWNEAAKIAHPNLLQIYKTGKCQIGGGEHIFIVMEYAEENLAEVLPHRPITIVEAIDMLRPVLGAVGYLHEKGFVHGNLKPANILAQGDQVKLASDSICRTGTSGAAGKRGPYDAPESDISPARDIWALGITIAEVLTQKRPSWTPGQPNDPSVPETLPQPFLDIVRNCLRPERQLRWNAAQILTRLHQPVSSVLPAPPASAASRQPTPQTPKTAPVAAAPLKPVQPKPAPPKQQPAKAKNKSYALPVIGVAVVCLAIAVLYYFVRTNSDSTSALPPAPQPQPTAEIQTTPETQAALVAPSGTPQTTPVPSSTNIPKPTVTPTTPQTGSTAVQTSAYTSPSPTPTATVSVTMQGVAQSEIAHQDVPSVTQKARDTITGKIKVSVTVTIDPSGQVSDAQLDNAGSSKFFSELALQSAKRWQFAPADETRQRLLRFTFQKYETDIAVAVAPQP